MTWNVFCSDFSTGEIKPHNVLHGRENLIQELKTKSASREEFEKMLRSEMIYHYWSKAEWEVVISPWCARGNKETKIDIFDQLKLNWDRFVDYCLAAEN